MCIHHDPKFHAKIATGHHKGLRLGYNPVDVGQGLRLLDFGTDLWSPLLGNVHTIHNVNQLLQILTLLSEGDTDVLDWRV